MFDLMYGILIEFNSFKVDIRILRPFKRVLSQAAFFPLARYNGPLAFLQMLPY